MPDLIHGSQGKEDSLYDPLRSFIAISCSILAFLFIFSYDFIR